MGDLLLPDIARMCGKVMVEGFAIDILCVVRKVVANRRRKIDIGTVGDGDRLALPGRWFLTRVKPMAWSEDQR
jgi:hypothetical protein